MSYAHSNLCVLPFESVIVMYPVAVGAPVMYGPKLSPLLINWAVSTNHCRQIGLNVPSISIGAYVGGGEILLEIVMFHPFTKYQVEPVDQQKICALAYCTNALNGKPSDEMYHNPKSLPDLLTYPHFGNLSKSDNRHQKIEC